MSVHRVPVIDRMIDVLSQLEQAEGFLGVRELAERCRVPRTTVYRIMNTLETHRMVVRDGPDGGYQLGSRLVALAARVPNGTAWQRLAAWSQPWLQRVASETKETAKLSVADSDAALCVAVAEGRSEYAVAARIGGRYPLHAGAASKILLAGMDPSRREPLLARQLQPYSTQTITDVRQLRAQLARIARQGWAEDTGEYSLGVRAVAAPVRDGQGRTIAALSTVCFAGRAPREQRGYREAVCRTAKEMSAAQEGFEMPITMGR